MDDWSTGDYTKNYGGTFYLPPSTADEGISLLDEDRPEDPGTHARVPGPWGYEGRRRGRRGGCREAPREGPREGAREGSRREGCRGSRREGYYTGGNVISDNENRRAVFDAAWDERPLHYNPHAGTDWSHLVPPQSCRPHGGGPAPSLAFPMITNSEAQVSPKDLFAAGPAGAPAPAARACCGAEMTLQVIKVILLFVIVVMLAMALAAAARAARALEEAARGRRAEGTAGAV